MSEELYDVIIIGGGPAGLSAAQYAARAGLKTLVLDRSRHAGALARTRRIENYPGLREPVSGPELLDIFREQAHAFGAVYLEAQVVGADLEGELKTVHGADPRWRARAVIIATGAMGRKPSIPGEAELLGRGVSYCATCDAPFFRGLAVCVAGDTEEALREAAHLARFAASVTLVTAVPPGAPCPQGVELLEGFRVTAIEGAEAVTGVRVRRISGGEERLLAVDGVFLYLAGALPVADFFDAALPRGERSCVLTHPMVETSLPGVFAAGDVTCAAVRQVVVSAACGCLAALAAEKFLCGRSRERRDWGEA